jgi:ornithine cyclodeaminase/alanine dehydrogenase
MHSDHGILYLSDAMVEEIAMTPGDVADAIEKALVDKAEGRLHTSPKSAILPGGGRYMMSTLAVGDDGFTVVKQVSVCPGNSERGLPAINGAIMVLDAETGLLNAVLGANWITAVRTAALSAVAARRLADPGSETIAFVGTGVQARAHLDAFAELFPIKRVRATGRGRTNLDSLLTKARGMGFETDACETPEEALREADLIVTSVTLDYSIEPFLDARWLKPNAFAAITDLCIPWMPDGLGAFGTVVVDDRVQEAESEKPMLPSRQIAADLTELVTGSVTLPTEDAPKAFAFRGIALGDYAAAVLAVRTARAKGLGYRISP